MSAVDIAAAFLEFARVDEDAITQMQLHKLLYFAQGLSLGLRGKPLFVDQIVAWKHGPVVPAVRDQCGAGATVMPEKFTTFGITDPTDKEFVRSVWIRFRDYSASALRAMTHDDGPWRESFQKENPVIPVAALRDHFSMPKNTGFDGIQILHAEVDFADGRYSDLESVKARVLAGRR